MGDYDNTNSGSDKPAVARFRQIAQALRVAIQNGVYAPGDQLPTEMELARDYQVSRVTAGAALKELARAGLVTRARRRGTIVQAGSPRLGTGSQQLVAWIVGHVEATFGLPILQGIHRATHAANLGLLLGNSGVTPEGEAQAIRDAVNLGAAGIMIYIQDGETYNAEVLKLVAGGYPIVLVDRYLRGVRSAIVSSDNLGGARMLVQVLLNAGHSRICVLTLPPSNTSTTEDRMRGYVEALTEAGVAVDYSLHYPAGDILPFDTDWEVAPSVVNRFAEFLRSHPDVSAIYATNARLGLVAYRATQLLHLRIPDDISIVCIDPLDPIPISLPQVTVAVQEGKAIGATAVALAQELLAGKPPRTVLFPMRLVDGGSVGPPPPVPRSAHGSERAVMAVSSGDVAATHSGS